ncbi:MAG: hypothetical protein MI673_07610 [Thiotrichales bacterium]|nr:hypothetical protein [Thiotrichales bacterium]
MPDYNNSGLYTRSFIGYATGFRHATAMAIPIQAQILDLELLACEVM